VSERENAGRTAEPAIRRARPEEAAALTALAHAAKAHWGYPAAWLAAWAEALTFTPEGIAADPVYVAPGPDGAPDGCYALGREGEATTLEHLWVRPDAMGRGLGRALLTHAARTAAAMGADRLQIDSDPYAEGFYLRAGAVRVGEIRADVEGKGRTLPRLLLSLSSERAAPG